MTDHELARIIVEFLEIQDHLACIGYAHDPWYDTITCACGETWQLDRITGPVSDD